MDEAEYLGDRIAIINEGEIKSIGSAQFYRDSYAPGFSIEITFFVNNDQNKFSCFLEEYKIEYTSNHIKCDKIC